MRIAVLGPGGVGGLVATLLAAAGHDVVALARASTAAHIVQNGLHPTSDRFGELRAYPQAAELLADPVDAVVLTTKATSLVDALDRLPLELVGGAVLLPLLNGVEHMALLRERYPSVSVVAGAIRVVAARTAPGEIRHSGDLGPWWSRSARHRSRPAWARHRTAASPGAAASRTAAACGPSATLRAPESA